MAKITLLLFGAISLCGFLSSSATFAGEITQKKNAQYLISSIHPPETVLFGLTQKSADTDAEPLELRIEYAGCSGLHLEESLLADIRRKRNEWLIIPHKPLKIISKVGTIVADKDCVLLISQGSDYLAIHNLHEHHLHSIHFEIETARFHISMASELLIAKSPDELTNLLAHCPVARRRVHIEQHGKDKCVATSEVKMVDIIKKSKLLAELGNRSDVDRKLKEQLIKSAACVSIVSAFHGPYHRYISGEKVMVPAIHSETIQEITTSSQHPSKGGYSSSI